MILTKYERVGRRTKNLLVLAVIVTGGIVVSVLDQAIYLSLHVDNWEDTWRMKEWAAELRTAGYVPFWIIFAFLVDGMIAWRGATYGVLDVKHAATSGGVTGCRLQRVPSFPGFLIVLGAGGAGFWAEMLKLVIRRHRPSDANQGTYVYDWISGPVAERGLGLASSHAGVAFGAAFIILMLSPGAGIVAILLAIGCSLTRMFSGAHFASDVYVAMVIAWAWAKFVWHIWERNRRVF